MIKWIPIANAVMIGLMAAWHAWVNSRRPPK